jgi:two-component system nitrate/nitrite response regulator NarL
MIVDDHPLVRAAVRQAMASSEFEVVADAATAEDALTQAPVVRPDILLVDIDLPGMDGVRLVRELAPRLPDMCIVMLTVSTADHDLVAAMRLGAKGYLTKDVSPDALVRAVRSAYHGELAVPRAMAARLVERLVDATHGNGHGAGFAFERLTPREDEVLRLLAEGLTDRQIGEALTISTRTVETHVSSVLHKLGAKNRAEATSRYREAR